MTLSSQTAVRERSRRGAGTLAAEPSLAAKPEDSTMLLPPLPSSPTEGRTTAVIASSKVLPADPEVGEMVVEGWTTTGPNSWKVPLDVTEVGMAGVVEEKTV